ncbi:MAG TPA: PKD domain-containing protein [Myxococcota bacterium]|nr:PKD domain-containing protein [Myxococcota bacterium]
MRRFLLLLLAVVFPAAGCVKRVPASAGPDISVRAGRQVELGRKMELPEGVRISWSFGDGAEIEGSLVAHAWDVAGNYKLRVSVSDPDGKTRSDEARVKVSRPKLLDLLGGSVDQFLLLDRPSERLRELPLLLEKFFVSGQAANATLARINEMLGFDPFDVQSLTGAGVDPAGHLGVLHIAGEGATGEVVVFPVLDREKALGTISQFFSPGAASEQPDKLDPSIVEELGADKKPVGAYTFYGGHAWLCKAGAPGLDPAALLAAVRAWDNGNKLIDKPDFKRAAAGQGERGPIELFVSGSFFQGAQKGGPAGSLDYLTGSARPDEAGLRFSGRLGLTDAATGSLLPALRSRTAVPPLGSFLPAGRHLFVKISANPSGLLYALADLSGQGAWARFQQTLGGVESAKRLLACLGDNLIVGVRLVPAGLLRLGNPQKSKPQEAVELIAVFELAKGEILARTLDELVASGRLGEVIKKGQEPGRKSWQLVIGKFVFTLAIEGSYAILAMPGSLVAQVTALIRNPGVAPAWWPTDERAGERQVFFADVNGFIEDFKRAEPPRDAPTAAFIKAMIMRSLSQVESLGTIMLKVAPQKQDLGFELEFDIK